MVHLLVDVVGLVQERLGLIKSDHRPIAKKTKNFLSRCFFALGTRPNPGMYSPSTHCLYLDHQHHPRENAVRLIRRQDERAHLLFVNLVQQVWIVKCVVDGAVHLEDDDAAGQGARALPVKLWKHVAGKQKLRLPNDVFAPVHVLDWDADLFARDRLLQERGVNIKVSTDVGVGRDEALVVPCASEAVFSCEMYAAGPNTCSPRFAMSDTSSFSYMSCAMLHNVDFPVPVLVGIASVLALAQTWESLDELRRLKLFDFADPVDQLALQKVDWNKQG